MAFSQKGSLFIWLTRSLLALYFSGWLGCLGSWSMVWAASWTWCSRLSWLAVGEQPVLWLVVGEPRRASLLLTEADRVRACAETRSNSECGPNVEIDRGIEREVEMNRDIEARSRDDPRWILEVTRIFGLDDHDVEMNRDDPLEVPRNDDWTCCGSKWPVQA